MPYTASLLSMKTINIMKAMLAYYTFRKGAEDEDRINVILGGTKPERSALYAEYLTERKAELLNQKAKLDIDAQRVIDAANAIDPTTEL